MLANGIYFTFLTWTISKTILLIFNNLTITLYPGYLFHVPNLLNRKYVKIIVILWLKGGQNEKISFMPGSGSNDWL